MRACWTVLVLICACSSGQRSQPAALSAAGSGAGVEAPDTGMPLRDAATAATPFDPPLSDAGQTAARPMDEATRDAGASDAGLSSDSREVLVGLVENARDLGGIPVATGGHIRRRSLFRGPPLANLSQRGCDAVAALGLRSVIDLRIDSEVALKPNDACALEQIQAQLVAAPLPVPYNVSAADYIAVLDARESLLQVFEVLADGARHPVYFHCTWGRDRTGILAALILLALGAAPDAIMEDYLESRRTVGAYPASLEAALEEIERRGGIDAYLTAMGVTSQQLEVIRAKTVERVR